MLSGIAKDFVGEVVEEARRQIHNFPLSEISLINVRVQLGTVFPDKYDWMCDAAMVGGALHLVGSHVIDLVSFLLKQTVLRVHGVVKSYTKSTPGMNGIKQISAPGFCNFQIELTNGTFTTTSIQSRTVPAETFSQEVVRPLVVICGSLGRLLVREGDLFLFKSKEETTQKEEAVYVDVQNLHFATSETLLPCLYIKGLCKMVGALKESFASKECNWIKEPVQYLHE
uniref:GFO/IDH/MocA-like oxidoreductase domain-containing protein n=1 Tax=Glossina pallidipes TaxID=7398 RepID=A0A1B0A996_GLOPL